MTWYVYIDGRLVGTVIAKNQPDATDAAMDKFHPGWCWMTVEKKPRKRVKKPSWGKG